MSIRALALGVFAVAASKSMADVKIYDTQLRGIFENPPNSSTGTGVSLVKVDTTAMTMRLQTTFTGLVGTATNSHIHVGNGPGTNGGVATMLPTFPGFPSGVTSGVYDQTFDMASESSYNPSFVTANGGTAATAFSALVTAMDQGKAYHNIHSSAFGGGEIRGDLQPVPEPATLAGLGLAACSLIARRRKRA